MTSVLPNTRFNATVYWTIETISLTGPIIMKSPSYDLRVCHDEMLTHPFYSPDPVELTIAKNGIINKKAGTPILTDELCNLKTVEFFETDQVTVKGNGLTANYGGLS